MNNYIEGLLQRMQGINKKTKELFGVMNEAELNKKPAPGKWSVGQVFDHLVIYNNTYIPIYEEVASGKYKESFWAKINPLSGFTGRFLIKFLKDDSKKFKAPSLFKPEEKHVGGNIINDFIENNNKLMGLFSKLDTVNIDKLKVPSPVSGIVTYYLKDSMEISVAHMERHLRQAERTLAQL